MMMVKAWRTADGTLFETFDAAKEYEIATSFKEWYENNSLPGDLAGSYVRYSDLVEWLEQHRVEILTFLHKEPECEAKTSSNQISSSVFRIQPCN